MWPLKYSHKVSNSLDVNNIWGKKRNNCIENIPELVWLILHVRQTLLQFTKNLLQETFEEISTRSTVGTLSNNPQVKLNRIQSTHAYYKPLKQTVQCLQKKKEEETRALWLTMMF